MRFEPVAIQPTNVSDRLHPMEAGRTKLLWINQRMEQIKDESTPGNHQLQCARTRRSCRSVRGTGSEQPATMRFERNLATGTRLRVSDVDLQRDITGYRPAYGSS